MSLEEGSGVGFRWAKGAVGIGKHLSKLPLAIYPLVSPRTFSLDNSSVSVHNVQFCVSRFVPQGRKSQKIK